MELQGCDLDGAEARRQKSTGKRLNYSSKLSEPDAEAQKVTALVQIPHDRNKVQLWLENEASGTGPKDTGIISRLFRACIDALACFIQLADSASTTKREKNTLQRCHDMLRLWADGHGIQTGRLDDVLERSRNLRSTTVSILCQMCKVLLNELRRNAPSSQDEFRAVDLCATIEEIHGQAKCLLVGLDENTNENAIESDSDSDDSEDGLEETQANEAIDSIKIYTNCLVDLSAALECPATDYEHAQNDHEPDAIALEPRTAQDFFTDLIRNKFSEIDTELAVRLGILNWDRYQRLQKERESNANVHVLAEDHSHKSRIDDSEFRDSGLGHSIAPTLSSYAETTISFMTGAGEGKHIKIPTLPAEAKAGTPFECNACGRLIKVTTTRDWRKHIFFDLQPYSCFYSDCSFVATPFSNRQLWITHLETDHELGVGWKSVQCPLCREPTKNGKSTILAHFARHMEDIALATLPCEAEDGTDSEAESQTKSQTKSQAEFQVELHAEKHAKWHKDEPSAGQQGDDNKNSQNTNPSEDYPYKQQVPQAPPLNAVNNSITYDLKCPMCLWEIKDGDRGCERCGFFVDDHGDIRWTNHGDLGLSNHGDVGWTDHGQLEAGPHGEFETKCAGCGKLFSGKYAQSNLMRHEKYACRSSATISCRFCDKVFQRPDAARHHERNVHGVEHLTTNAAARPEKRHFEKRDIEKADTELRNRTTPTQHEHHSLDTDTLPHSPYDVPSARRSPIMGPLRSTTPVEQVDMLLQQSQLAQQAQTQQQMQNAAPTTHQLQQAALQRATLHIQSQGVLSGHNPATYRNLHDANEAKAMQADIERRCQEMDPPIPPNVLHHMESFRAALHISQPLTDYAWKVLRPRLLAQLPAAQQAHALLSAETTENDDLLTDIDINDMDVSDASKAVLQGEPLSLDAQAQQIQHGEQSQTSSISPQPRSTTRGFRGDMMDYPTGSPSDVDNFTPPPLHPPRDLQMPPYAYDSTPFPPPRPGSPGPNPYDYAYILCSPSSPRNLRPSPPADDSIPHSPATILEMWGSQFDNAAGSTLPRSHPLPDPRSPSPSGDKIIGPSPRPPQVARQAPDMDDQAIIPPRSRKNFTDFTNVGSSTSVFKPFTIPPPPRSKPSDE